MKKALTLLLKIIAVVVFFALLSFVLIWFPVIDRLGNWCAYYPETVTDCKND